MTVGLTVRCTIAAKGVSRQWRAISDRPYIFPHKKAKGDHYFPFAFLFLLLLFFSFRVRKEKEK